MGVACAAAAAAATAAAAGQSRRRRRQRALHLPGQQQGGPRAQGGLRQGCHGEKRLGISFQFLKWTIDVLFRLWCGWVMVERFRFKRVPFFFFSFSSWVETLHVFTTRSCSAVTVTVTHNHLIERSRVARWEAVLELLACRISLYVKLDQKQTIFSKIVWFVAIFFRCWVGTTTLLKDLATLDRFLKDLATLDSFLKDLAILEGVTVWLHKREGGGLGLVLLPFQCVKRRVREGERERADKFQILLFMFPVRGEGGRKERNTMGQKALWISISWPTCAFFYHSGSPDTTGWRRIWKKILVVKPRSSMGENQWSMRKKNKSHFFRNTLLRKALSSSSAFVPVCF